MLLAESSLVRVITGEGCIPGRRGVRQKLCTGVEVPEAHASFTLMAEAKKFQRTPRILSLAVV